MVRVSRRNALRVGKLMRSRSWSSRSPPLFPWWHPVADALEPVGELFVLGLAWSRCRG